ncbi:stage III sporulation protein AB [Halobacillus litoralis]|uniref:Stage III sporulation protein AB n=1 Tax=Halobacillus litoralis TaxID=45668 RepID=A0A845DQG6_9BACI|nr:MULTISPECIES: stage III sporulation protein SpoIIIAB [Halobacillus]MYL19740.1 stage III sporulation protein AB [Halobacillus litoralis]MYL28886.1 stage III sporulation protein AB [Halobacillus halophilus]MYL37137.1 stage III sporulation protein AB [Halobacillus litoralis]
MEWMGAVIILTVTTLGGFEIASRFKKRPGHIRQWKNALQLIEAEMVYGQSSLWEVCDTLSRHLPMPVAGFFEQLQKEQDGCREFAVLWESMMKKHWPWNAMGKTELEILLQFGRTLGQHDLEQQQKQIQLTIHHLDRVLQEALEVGEQYQKMARGMGVLSGLLVIILII